MHLDWTAICGYFDSVWDCANYKSTCTLAFKQGVYGIYANGILGYLGFISDQWEEYHHIFAIHEPIGHEKAGKMVIRHIGYTLPGIFHCIKPMMSGTSTELFSLQY